MQNSRNAQHTYDVIVIGAGGLFGSSALYNAAKISQDIFPRKFLGKPRILGIEQFPINHTNGSSHGESRITRVATGEGPEYVQLAQRSHDLWREIETKTDKQFGQLCHLVGGLIISSDTKKGTYHGSQDGFLQQTRMCAQEFKIPHQNLNAAEMRKQFPQFKIEDTESAYFEKETMGFIRPEACIKAQLHLAQQHGAELHIGEKLLNFWKMPDGRMHIHTIDTKGNAQFYQAHKIILTTGSWTPQLLQNRYTPELNVYRQTVYWFEVEESARTNYAIGKILPFIWDGGIRKGIVYGFPIMEGNFLKIGSEKFLTTTTPENVDRNVSEAEVTEMYDNFIAPNFVGITKKCVKKMACLYTVAPHHRFLIDYLPGYDKGVVMVSACSGHGAKHSAAVGEAVAQICMLGEANINVIRIFGGMQDKMEIRQQRIRAKL